MEVTTIRITVLGLVMGALTPIPSSDPDGRRRGRLRIVTGRGTAAPSAPVRTIQVRRSSVGPRLCTLLVCTLLAAGCADPDGAPPGGTSEGPGTSGDALALQPVLEGSSALRLATAPTLVLGDDSGRAGHAFGKVVGAVLLPDGGIAVLDQMSSVLSFFAPDGAWLASVGGPGDGPGELRRPLALRLAPDGSLEAEDLSGLTRFAADGTVLGTERTDYAGLFSRAPGWRFSSDCHASPVFAGSWRLMIPCRDAPPPDETGPFTVTAPVLRFDDRWEEPVLLGEPVQQSAWWFRFRSATGFGVVWAHVPFWTRGLFAVGATPPRLVYARTDRYGFEVIDLETGAEAFRIERPDRRIAPDPFSQAREWGTWESWADRFRELGGMLGYPAIEQQLEELRAMIPMPDSIEHVAALIVADDGSIWVRWTPGLGTGGEAWLWDLVEQGHLDSRWLEDRPAVAPWDVYDAEGRFLNTLELPFNLEPTHIGSGFVLGVMAGEMGVELVALYALEGGR